MMLITFALCVLALGMPCLAEDAKKSKDIYVDEPGQIENFSGSWVWSEGGDRFALTLTQTGDTLTGFHSSSQDGEKNVDFASTNLPPSINGEVNGDSVVVRFKSGAPGSQGYGHARLLLRGRYLYWTKMDESGQNFLPEHAILIRQEPVAP